MKDIKMPSPSSQKDVAASPDKETRNYDDVVSTEDSIISKIKSKIERTGDTHNKENIKYLINIIMEDFEHPLHEEIDKQLACRNDVLDMLNNLRVDDQIREIMQCLIREIALGKMSSCIYNYAVCKLYSANEILSSKVKEYFIKSILKDSEDTIIKKSPIAELKMLEKIIDY
ncbi:hypothetical protein [Fowlpox virus]|nr:hypothetical protein [Fowlpox virus]